MEDALTHVDRVVTSIRDKELFHSIEITYRQCWEHLVWYDVANFGGVQGKLPENLQEQTENDEENSENDENEDGVSSKSKVEHGLKIV